MTPLLLLSIALADVPPPPGYVETCTVEKQCTPTEEGVSCGAWFGEPDACAHLLAEGWVLRCRTSGASVWSEVYCRGAGRSERAEGAQEGAERGSGAAKAGCASAAWGGVMAFGALLLAWGGLRARREPAPAPEVEEERRRAA